MSYLIYGIGAIFYLVITQFILNYLEHKTLILLMLICTFLSPIIAFFIFNIGFSCIVFGLFFPKYLGYDYDHPYNNSAFSRKYGVMVNIIGFIFIIIGLIFILYPLVLNLFN